MEKINRNHFLVIKKSGYSSDGRRLSARESTDVLINAGFWPLWKNTRCKNMIKQNNDVLFYLAGSEKGSQCIIANAKIASVEMWSDKLHKKSYPLMLDGVPEMVLKLDSVSYLLQPIRITALLDKLSFIPENKNKWGVALMGGVRSLTDQDYQLLSTCPLSP